MTQGVKPLFPKRNAATPPRPPLFALKLARHTGFVQLKAFQKYKVKESHRVYLAKIDFLRVVPNAGRPNDASIRKLRAAARLVYASASSGSRGGWWIPNAGFGG